MPLVALKGAIPGGAECMCAIVENFVHGIHILLHEETGYNAG